MRWKILVEEKPGTFADAKLEVFDDQYASDGSEWGNDESKTVSNHMAWLTSIDENGRSYAATLAPDEPEPVKLPPEPEPVITASAKTMADRQRVK